MATTHLHAHLAARSARSAEYAGALTVAAFSDPAHELEALRTGCGVFDLGWRSKLIATGEDRVRWFNGMVTNNIRDLAANRGTYNFLLNAQGRILGDMYLYNRGEYVLLDTDASQARSMRETLDKFIIMDDVELANADDKLTAIGVGGPRSAEVLQAVGFDFAGLEPLEVRDAEWRGAGISVVRNEDVKHSGYEIWLTPTNAAALWDALAAAGATPVGTEALEMWRVAMGVPRYGQDIRERDLPQETEQYRALNFNKGCYVGQEIVERIRSRGQVHRKFAGFEIEGAVPAAGTKLKTGGKEVGEITSAAILPVNGGRTLALGYVRREAGAPGAVLEAAGASAKVAAQLPFEGF
jgi:folate-binding protein YgfZ